MKGIDIYGGSGVIDFEKVKNSGVEIVYIKATEGVTYSNPSLHSYYNLAKASGLKVGVYHYLRNDSPLSEANNFLTVIKGLDLDCKYVIDVEDALGQTVEKLSSNVRQFADCLIKSGKSVGMYTDDGFYANSLNSTVKDLPLWIAHYNVTKPTATNYVGFQYTDTGIVEGIVGNVDLSNFSNDMLLVAPAPVAKVEPVIYNKILHYQQLVNALGIKDMDDKVLGADGVIGIKTQSTYAKMPVEKLGADNVVVGFIQTVVEASPINCKFDANTQIKVKDYQKEFKQVEDGIVGKETYKILVEGGK
jgi:peptidoglycan hydrolase-like protein with peptidoglycan-binding domain